MANSKNVYNFKNGSVVIKMTEGKLYDIYIVREIYKNHFYVHQSSNQMDYAEYIPFTLDNVRKYSDPADHNYWIQIGLSKKNLRLNKIAVIEKIKQAAISVFGEENVDIQNTERDLFYPYLIIKFDEIEITNAYDLKHTIRDVYVRFIIEIGNESIKIYQMEMCRFTFTNLEVSLEYMHSHVNWESDERLRFYTFCTGDGEFADLYYSLKSSCNNIYSFMNKFEFLLVSLESFLGWESVEGGPHRHMSYLSRYKNIENLNDYPRNNNEISRLKDLFHYYIADNDIELEPITVGNNFFLGISENTIDEFIEKNLDSKEVYCVDGIYYKEANRNYEGYDSINDFKSSERFKFKGEPIEAKVIPHVYDEEDFPDSLKTYSPIYKKTLLEYFNKGFIEFQILEYGRS